jgi:molecular chaperone Hsp33
LLGREELSEMLNVDGKAELICHFCSNRYVVDREEMIELIKGLSTAA